MNALRWIALLTVTTCGPALAEGGDTSPAAELKSPGAKVAQAQVQVDGARNSLAYATGQLEQAQAVKDIIRINCVSDKLSGIRGLLKIAETAQVGAVEASKSGDQELLDHQVTKISIASMQVENFRVEVEGCMGEASRYTGDTVVTLNIDKDVRTDNPATETDADVYPPVAFDQPEAIRGNECASEVSGRRFNCPFDEPDAITASE